MTCKCWPATIPAASRSCANCVTGRTFYWDQSNVPDTNFWTLSGDAAASRGSPPLYSTLDNTTLSVTRNARFDETGVGVTLGFLEYTWRLLYSVQGAVGGTLDTRRLQWGSGVNGRWSINHEVSAASNIHKRRIQIKNDSGGILYTNDLTMGTSPFSGVDLTGTVKVIQVAAKTFDFYLDGVLVHSGYVATLADPNALSFNVGWKSGSGGANSRQSEFRLGRIYMESASGLPFSCCG